MSWVPREATARRGDRWVCRGNVTTVPVVPKSPGPRDPPHVFGTAEENVVIPIFARTPRIERWQKSTHARMRAKLPDNPLHAAPPAERMVRSSVRRVLMRLATVSPTASMLVFTAITAVCACGGSGGETGFSLADDGGASPTGSQGGDGSVGSSGSSSGSGGSSSAGTGPAGDDGSAQGDDVGISDGGDCQAACGGCCDANGNCEVGTDDSACGIQGAVCVDCTGTSQTCQSGTCAGPSGSSSGGSSGASSGFGGRDGGRTGSSGSSGGSSGFGGRDGGRRGSSGSGSGGSSGFGGH